MDSIEMEKLIALNKCKRGVNNFILYTSTALTCLVFCSSPFWLPPLISSIKAFAFVTIPNITLVFFNPKCLFVVCNVIVVFLIGESKFGGSNSSSPDIEIYDEYVKRSSSLRRQPSPAVVPEVKETSLVLASVEEEEKEREVVVEEALEVEDEKGGDEELVLIQDKQMVYVKEEEVEGEAEEEELGLPAEELNKKVEDFIAKINHQRRLEARLLVSGIA